MAEPIVTLEEAEGQESIDRREADNGRAGIAGLRQARERSGKIQLATRHLSILTSLLLATLGGALWILDQVEAEGTELLGLGTGWLLLFLVAFAGALVNRMVALSFTGFRFKTYDPYTFPNQLVLAVRAPFVALALFGLLGENLVPGGGTSDLALVAVAFSLGYFGDMAFEKLRDLVRTLLGQGIDSDKPDLPLIGGIDVPLAILKMDHRLVEKLLETDDVETLVDDLNAKGIEYAHEYLALAKTKEGRGMLHRAAGLSPRDLEKLRELLDVTRTGATVVEAVALVRAGMASADAIEGLDAAALENSDEGLGMGLFEDGANPVEARVERLRANARSLLEPL